MQQHAAGEEARLREGRPDELERDRQPGLEAARERERRQAGHGPGRAERIRRGEELVERLVDERREDRPVCAGR